MTDDKTLKEIALAAARDDNKQRPNPKYVQAQKEGKVDYSTIPWRVIGQLAQAMMEGAGKYGRFNYREDEIEARTYIAAICRHLFGDPSTGSIGWVNGEDIDKDSGLPHLVKIMACCLLVEDSRIEGTLIDNRLQTESKKPPAEREDYDPTKPDSARDRGDGDTREAYELGEFDERY